MELINDEAYAYYAVKVMTLNLYRLRGTTLESAVNSLLMKGVTYLKFRLRKPIVTFLEGIS